MRCAFRETPPPLARAYLVDVSRLRQAIVDSFYGGASLEVALYPSLEDAVAVLSERLGGLYKASSLPMRIARLVGARGRVPVFSNPTPSGEKLTCDTICVHDTVVVYEGNRVYYPVDTLLSCDCKVYSIGALEEYGVDSSVAWVAGLDGGVRGSRLPGVLELGRLTRLVRRLRERGLVASRLYSEAESVGPFAAFYAEKPRIIGEVVDAAKYGVVGLWAISLFMEPGCYLRV